MLKVSHSRLSTFENCKLQYKYKYVDKRPAARGQTIETFMGSRVHDTLERLYKDLKFQKLQTEEELVALYNSEWEKLWKDDIIVVKEGLTPDHYRKTGEKALRSYYNRFHPFDQSTVLAIEKRILFPLDTKGDIQVLGFIDRLDRTAQGVYEIHDYKTSGRLPSQEDADKDRQLALYSLAVKQDFPDAKEIKLIWHYLLFDTERISVRSDEELQALKQNTLELAQSAIESTDFPAHTSPLCNYCEYQPICPEWAHKFKSEKLSADKYANEPGVKLVDEYVRFSTKKKEIEKQLEEVKIALLAFGDKEGVDTVYGSAKRAKLWRKNVVRLPGHDDPRQEELISLLRLLSKFDEVSRLDTWELAKIIEAGRWRPEIINELKKYYSREEVRRIYLSDKK